MEDIRFKSEGRVAVITLNRRDDDNRMTFEVLERLEMIADDLAKDEEVLAVILTGSGEKFFSAGMLHPKVRATLTRTQILAMVRLANIVFDKIEALPQVTIAALNGVTRAGAAEMTLACDMRIAASPVRLPGLVGRARALELICTARELNAQEMEAWGLTLSTHAPDKLMDAAYEIAGRVAACGPLAIRGAKRIVNVRERAGFAAARELSDALRHALESTSDMAEGQAAILEGRAPRFTGK
jgi:enoyl-CoA hydratase/carnithine racemase